MNQKPTAIERKAQRVKDKTSWPESRIADRDWLYREYIINSKTMTEIGREVNRHKSAVRYWMLKHQIPIRRQANSTFGHFLHYALISKDIDSCWEWTGPCNDHGYGLIRSNNKNERAHRIAYQLYKGPIPDGLFVCHHCDNPPCVNPFHLFVCTLQENTQDAVMKGIRFGPKRKFDLDEAKKLRAQGFSYIKIGRKLGVSGTTILRSIRESSQ
jgi:hypothetical protein